MTTPTVKTLIALDDGVDAASIEASLGGAGPLQVIGIAEGFDQSWTLLEETSPDLLVVATHGSSERALYLIEGASRQRPERPVVVFYLGTPNGFVQRAFAAGADDMVCLPQPVEDVRFALEKVLARRRGATTASSQSPMIAVLGPKGGTGKTLTACNLAVSFAKEGKRTALVDLDLQFGDVGIALGLSPDRTIYDLVRAGASLDADKVEDYLTVHPGSGLRVLLAPTRPDQAGLISIEFLAQVYKTLRTTFDVVVVDTPPAFSPEVIATIDSASHLCMVGMLDALSLKDSKLGLETLELMGHDASKITFVLNRSSAKAGISRADAEAILGRTLDAFVPEDSEIPRLLTRGEPIVLASGRSAVARAFSGFASDYMRSFETAQSQPADTNGHRSGGLRAMLFGRKRG